MEIGDLIVSRNGLLPLRYGRILRPLGCFGSCRGYMIQWDSGMISARLESSIRKI